MELRISYFGIYIISALIIIYIEAKSISLNDIIAAERQGIELPSEISSSDNSYTRKSSPLKYKKTFEIKSPSKPKKLKYLQKPRYKRKNLTTKREVIYNDSINKKYIPLLRNIGMLFDNILSSDSSETYDSTRYKYKRNPVNTERDDSVCTCVSKNDTRVKSNSRKKTAFSSFTTEDERETTIFTTATPPYNITVGNDSNFGRNKNISLLLARNPSGIRRNNYRFRERRGSSLNRGFQRYIAGDQVDNEHYAHIRKTNTDTKYNEQHTNSDTRDDASRDRSRERGSRIDPRDPEIDRTKTAEYPISSNETTENDTRNVLEHERETQFEIRGNKTKDTGLLPELTSGLRGIKAEEKKISLRAAEAIEENKEHDYTSNKPITDRNGAIPAEDQGISTANKSVNLKNSKTNSNFPGKVVMIFDGYSVARDVNGENKLTEKAIHIHG